MGEEQNEHVSEGLLNLDEVMQAFGVTEWENQGLLEELPGQGMRWRVELGGERYILRERPEGMVGEDLRHRYEFQRYLRQAGLPVPAYWQTPQGDTSVTIGEDSFELQAWPRGELFSSAHPRTLEHVAWAGSMLGRIHQASQRYQGLQHRWPEEAHMGAVVQGYLNLARARAEEHVVAAIGTALIEWVERWEMVLPQAMMAIGAGRNLPEWHLHGDYHAHHLRFGDADVTAVMGLEASHWEKRLFEVASALFSFSALAWYPGGSMTPPLVKRGFDPERAQHFLQAYGGYCPPVPGEALLLVDALMLVAPILTINGPLEDLFYAQGEVDEMLIDETLERLSWAASLPAWLGRVRRSLPEMWSR
jgi:Ser/Thr protein kinase RdoA (MazF antagonist)